MKHSITIIIALLIGLLLVGCTGNTVTTIEEPIIEEKPVIKEKEPIAFAGKSFEVPSSMAIFHNAHDFPGVMVDSDMVYLTVKGNTEDLCALRYGKLSAAVTSTEKADEIMKAFCKPEQYGSVDVAYSDTALCGTFYYQMAITTALNEQEYVFLSMVPKNTSDVYSVTFKADESSVPLCTENETKVILNSLQTYTGYELNQDYFYNCLLGFIKTKTMEMNSFKNLTHVPALRDEDIYTILPGQEYYLELDTGIYEIAHVEGAGDVYIEDSRFGVRTCMMGYTSDNSADVISNVTLVHGGKIYTTLGLEVKIIQ